MPAPDESEPGTSAPGTSDVVAVVASGPALADAARRCWDEGRTILPFDPGFTAGELDELHARLRPAEPAAAGTAAIVVTSGTAGAPKGVELTRAGMEVMARGYSAGLGMGPDDRWLACLPLHHVAGLGVLARAYVTGVPCTVHEGFDVERVARSPATEGTTVGSLVPTALRRLLDAGAPMHEFRRIITGGAPCPPALRARAEAAGARVVDAYGLTETWGGFALDGRPIAGTEARIDEREGEILVRGAVIMRGYRFDPDRTAATVDAGGWLHTGDVGELDSDGRIRVVDRLKDLVITGGVNVSPTEIEAVLAHHRAVDDVCVAGVPDDEWGERVVAFVVPRPGMPEPSLADLRAFARDRLSAPKLPREVRIVAAIPRTPGGKPLRRQLRESS
ncbi:MAG TPA: fatty acid--CoA ligase family protein [Acidimicrobiia bacterium]|nr:fatty acid--CoA ligase family protein [Acidimicrobiia bacterium]